MATPAHKLTRRDAFRGAAVLGGGLALSRLPLVPAGASAAAAGPSAECAERYAGYRAADRRLPYAKYFTEKTAPPPDAIRRALAAGPVDPAKIPPRTALADDIHNPGYSKVETGYGRLPNGEIWVGALTDMPGVRPEMWDWWLGWFSDASAKSKLWHPEAHQFAAIKHDRVADTGLSDRQKYIGNVSYLDELFGPHLQQAAVSYVEPSEFGIEADALPGTVMCAYAGSSVVPGNVIVICHQIRPTERGSENRQRFYLNVPGVKELDADAALCATRRGVPPSQAPPPYDLAYGALTLEHIGAEQNHLAQFLPELYAEFGPPSRAPLELSAARRRGRVGRRTEFVFEVSAGGEPIPRATVRFGGRKRTTGRDGKASFKIRPRRAGRRRVLATRSKGDRAYTLVRIRPRRRRRAKNGGPR